MVSSSTKKIVKGITGIVGGRQNEYAVLRSLHSIRAWTLRKLSFVGNGFRDCSAFFPLRRFSERDRQVFFGYYDISPINFDDSILLAVRAPLPNVSACADISLEVGCYDLRNGGGFVKIADTITWCWQQGCRLQWYPLNNHGKNNTVIYNTLVNGVYGSCIQNIQTKAILAEFGRPIYGMSPDGRYGFSLPFSRLGRLRPGYGYVALDDETEGDLAPVSDGLWRIDMDSGGDELLFSISDIAKIRPQDTMKGAEHYFNHICVNPTGNRLLFFHIWKNGSERHTRIITCNTDGSEPYILVSDGVASHYTWKDQDTLLCIILNARRGEKRYCLYKDRTTAKSVIGSGVLNLDGHPSYSHDRKLLLTDTYMDKYGCLNLLLFDVQKAKLIKLGAFFTPTSFVGELKCDLHPRWSPSGRYVALDSAHNGKREMYVMDISALIDSHAFK